MSCKPAIKVVYTNWKGKTEKRNIIPIEAYWGHTEFHKEDQFLLKCIDVDKGAERTYAMKYITKIEDSAPYSEGMIRLKL